MASEEFHREALQVLSYVPGPVGHERQAKIFGATANVSPQVLEYIKSHIKKNSGY
jgi:hypothetical protein